MNTTIKDQFDLMLIIGQALITGESPKAIIERLMGSETWFFSRQTNNFSTMYFRASGPNGYEMFIEGEGWHYRPYVGEEKTWLNWLAVEHIEKFFVKFELDWLKQELAKIQAADKEVNGSQKEAAGNHETIQAQASSAANLFNSIPLNKYYTEPS